MFTELFLYCKFNFCTIPRIIFCIYVNISVITELFSVMPPLFPVFTELFSVYSAIFSVMPQLISVSPELLFVAQNGGVVKRVRQAGDGYDNPNDGSMVIINYSINYLIYFQLII